MEWNQPRQLANMGSELILILPTADTTYMVGPDLFKPKSDKGKLKKKKNTLKPGHPLFSPLNSSVLLSPKSDKDR